MQEYIVEIFGKEYRIKSDGAGEEIHKIAEYINNELKNLQSSSFAGTQVDLAIMVAFKAANDYFQVQGDLERLQERIEKDAADLSAQIDAKMTGGYPGPD